MKLVVAMVQDRDWPQLRDRLVDGGFRITRLASSGGFLRQGNTTALIGVEDGQVDSVVSIVREICSSREEYVNPTMFEHTIAMPVSVMVGGGTVFVVDVDRFEKV